MRWIAPAIVTLTVLVPSPAPAGGASLIEVFDNGFNPDSTEKLLPATPENDLPVTWKWCPDEGGTGACAPGSENLHNVREDHKLFYSGAPAGDRPDFERRFSSGTFHYFCEPHGYPAGGMDGLVRVMLGQGMTTDGYPKLIWASSVTQTGEVFDVHYRVDGGLWKSWRENTPTFFGAFGRNDKPQHWNPAREYEFKARSQKNASTPNAVSRWSPITLWD